MQIHRFIALLCFYIVALPGCTRIESLSYVRVKFNPFNGDNQNKEIEIQSKSICKLKASSVKKRKHVKKPSYHLDIQNKSSKANNSLTLEDNCKQIRANQTHIRRRYYLGVEIVLDPNIVRNPQIVRNARYVDQKSVNQANRNEQAPSTSGLVARHGFRPVTPTREEVRGQILRDIYLHAQNPKKPLATFLNFNLVPQSNVDQADRAEAAEALLLLSEDK